ncbi:MAG: NAD(P)-dependent oxidoreductase [Bacteriovoracaceae bacterium]|jgi:nucleoside-diphosphate-sugar epimerase|nr:NAD(P)-dependent oxidoreductase [Bacteriovoracaceae bacterium]
MLRPLKIFVTGSTGFVGSHLCELLTKEGHIVYGLARSQEKFNKMSVNATCIEGSLSKDCQFTYLNSLPDDLDAVFHTAGIVSSYKENRFYDVNYHSTENFINQLKDKYNKIHFILISSLAAAGPNAPVESDIPNPVSHYGKSKLLAEKALLTSAPNCWQKTVVRPPMVIGPGDTAILEIFKMVNNKIVLIAGLDGLDNEYSFICVYDLISLLKNTLDITLNNIDQKEMRIFFSSHPDTIRMSDLLNTIRQYLKINQLNYIKLPIFLIRLTAHIMKALSFLMKQELLLTPDKVSELAPSKWICSGKLSEEELQVKYQWNLGKTIEVTLKDYQARGWL